MNPIPASQSLLRRAALRLPALALGSLLSAACTAMPPAVDRSALARVRGTEPDGRPFALALLPTGQWRFVGDAAWLRVSGRPDPPEADDALNVTVDGPTGFVFVWTRNAGWRFVGRAGGSRS